MLFSITDSHEREAKLTQWKNSHENLIKSERKNFEKYLEEILKLGEYTRINQLMFEQLKTIFFEEADVLLTCIVKCSENKDYPAAEFMKKFKVETLEICKNLKA